MIDALISGKLYGQPAERIDKAGKPYVVAKVRAVAGDGETLFVNVIAFDASTCSTLLSLTDGDSAALTGSITPRVWTDKEGNHRPSLDMVATQLLTAYHVKQKRAAAEMDRAAPHPEHPDSGDIPY